MAIRKAHHRARTSPRWAAPALAMLLFVGGASTPAFAQERATSAPTPVRLERDRPLSPVKVDAPVRSAEGAPTKAQPEAAAPSSLDWIARTALSLVGVVALIGIAAYVVRRVSRSQGGLMAALGPGGRAPSGVVEVLGRYPIARGTTLVLLKVDRRVLLLCQAASRRVGGGPPLSTLSEFTDAEEVASILVKTRDDEGDSMARRFESMLSGFSKGGEKTPTARPPASNAIATKALVPKPVASNTRLEAKPATNPATKAQAVAALQSRLATMRSAPGKGRAA